MVTIIVLVEMESEVTLTGVEKVTLDDEEVKTLIAVEVAIVVGVVLVVRVVEGIEIMMLSMGVVDSEVVDVVIATIILVVAELVVEVVFILAAYLVVVV